MLGLFSRALGPASLPYYRPVTSSILAERKRKQRIPKAGWTFVRMRVFLLAVAKPDFREVLLLLTAAG